MKRSVITDIRYKQIRDANTLHKDIRYSSPLYNAYAGDDAITLVLVTMDT